MPDFLINLCASAHGVGKERLTPITVVVLSDRVVAMTAGPGRIEADITIELARPREVSSIDFNQVRRDITQRLTSHLARRELKAVA